jgi:hypothetical protein
VEQQLKAALVGGVDILNAMMSVTKAAQGSPGPAQQHDTAGGDDVAAKLVPDQLAAAGSSAVQTAAAAGAQNRDDIEGRECRLPPAAAAEMLGELPLLLQGYGEELWSLLPQPHCCNNWECSSMAGISESKLVMTRRDCRCSSCKVAK